MTTKQIKTKAKPDAQKSTLPYPGYNETLLLGSESGFCRSRLTTITYESALLRLGTIKIPALTRHDPAHQTRCPGRSTEII